MKTPDNSFPEELKANHTDKPEEYAKVLGSQVVEAINARTLPIMQAYYLLNPDHKVHHAEVAGNSAGYTSCKFSNGQIISLEGSPENPNINIGTNVIILRGEEGVRGPSSKRLLGNERGTVVMIDVTYKSNDPNESVIIMVTLEDDRCVQVYPDSIQVME